MKNPKQTFLTVILMSFLIAFSSSGRAEEQGDESYGDKIGTKAKSGLANIGAGLLEIPKNAINISNDTNVVWGIAAGLPYGAFQSCLRIGSGILDLVTFYIPTTPIAHPVYIWDDFDATTTYGDGLRLEDRSLGQKPIDSYN